MTDTVYGVAAWLEIHYLSARPKQSFAGEAALLACTLAEVRRRGVCLIQVAEVLRGGKPRDRDLAPCKQRQSLVTVLAYADQRLRSTLTRLRKARLGKAWRGDPPYEPREPYGKLAVSRGRRLGFDGRANYARTALMRSN